MVQDALLGFGDATIYLNNQKKLAQTLTLTASYTTPHGLLSQQNSSTAPSLVVHIETKFFFLFTS